MSVQIVDEELDQLDGKGLRSKLEAALAENRELKKKVATSEAQEILRSNGYDLVKPEDLSEVPLEEMATKAKELQEQRLAERRTIVEDLLKARGYSGEELKAEVEAWMNPEGSESEPAGGSDDGSWKVDMTGGRLPREADSKLPPLTDPVGNFMDHFSKRK